MLRHCTNRLHGARIRVTLFRHISSALSITLLTSPGKASGKSTDSLVTALGRQEESKQFLGFHTPTGCFAWEISTSAMACHPLQSLLLWRQLWKPTVKHCPERWPLGCRGFGQPVHHASFKYPTCGTAANGCENSQGGLLQWGLSEQYGNQANRNNTVCGIC